MSRFEFLHPVIFYAPVFIYALWLMVRYRSMTLPALANPSIFAGGAVGERKSDVFELAGPYAASFIAPSTTLTPYGSPAEQLEQASKAMDVAQIAFPIVAKPDTGLRGSGVRPIHSTDELATYLTDFPAGHRIMLQKKVPYSAEAGIFYIRHPDQAKGSIFSLTMKYTATVEGDGKRTLAELIDACPRCKRMGPVYLQRHAGRLKEVLPAGEVFALNFAGNHAKGSIFRDGQAHICDALTDVV
ncbi:MAG: D-alanine--D-alanine ligase, partial [Pseudomonadota bacterium]